VFQIGDKVFYPAQGGGIIETIEEREVFGETQMYYSISMPHRNMQVMIPIDKTEQLGIRHIVEPEQLDKLLITINEGETDMSGNDNQLDRKNMLKIRSGNIYEGAEVIRDLVRISAKRKLGTTRKNMLDNALQILISEIVLVKGIPREQASDLIESFIHIQ
jgi:CarD family transcriptional regulator